MSKLYIATTTLNFNNILSTESISPASVYSERKFGYKRLEIVEPNNFDDVIIAYSKPPIFRIEDNDLDSYPLVIEVCRKIIEDKDIKTIGKHNDIDIFAIPKTIYLNHNKVKFLFLDKNHKETTLIKSESSIETKLIPIYLDKLGILQETSGFSWNDSYCNYINGNKKNLDNNDIKSVASTDRQINSIKGFYFCYILGIYLEPDDQIKKAIIKNGEIILNKFDLKDWEKFCETFKSSTKKIIEGKYFNIINDISIEGNEIKSISNSDDNIQAKLYTKILNDISKYDPPINNENDFKAEKIDLLKKIGDNFKKWECFYDKEEKELSIKYIRALLENIKNYEPLNIAMIEKSKFNVLLKSITLFILKGDDLEKLLKNLVESDLKTFKIAFGLWGATFGFSAIPKTIFRRLFENEPKNIINIQDVFDSMYKKIHNIKCGELITIQRHLKEGFKTNTNSEAPKEETKCNSLIDIDENQKEKATKITDNTLPFKPSEIKPENNLVEKLKSILEDGKEKKISDIMKPFGFRGVRGVNKFIEQLKHNKEFKIDIKNKTKYVKLGSIEQ